ncbi:MAG: 16S rRNA (cytosine(967)-C(5))-methyltransferase RsmB [Streptococcus sp.]|nr:16S rRNA (cytosine(967)-C(5))-methyltransferase RsmB [Streptococcus sp.]
MGTNQKNARSLALAVLEDVLLKEAYSNIALHKHLSQSHLSQADKSLVTEIVYGTVARKITLEWYLSHVITNRDVLDKWIYILLMQSLYQLLYLDKIPARAIINEAVEIAKKRKIGSEKYVNAILRRLDREGVADVATIKRKSKRFSIQYSLPVWMVNALIDEYGEKRAEAIFSSLFAPSKASIRVINLSQKQKIKELLEAEESLISSTALVKNKGHFAAHELFKTGQITIQDETSQLVAPFFQIQGNERILDACSAPGGKTAHMASYLTDGKIVALDLYEHKLELVRETVERLGLSDKVSTKQLDATKVYQEFGKNTFDKILVDAPCSGIGLIRRKPDIKYNKENADFENLQKIQLDILDSVCQSLCKGGIITYSTCTIMSQENFDVVMKFLDRHPNFEQVVLDHERKDIVKNGCILITPELYGSDGFFISQFRKVSE